MTPRFMLRIALTTMIALYITLFGSAAAVTAANAGAPDSNGNNAEIYSITLSPDTIAAGTYPEIKGFVRNTSAASNGDGGKAAFSVEAVITSPGGAQKSMIWREVRFTADQRKSYTAANSYDTKQAGTYKVVYSVYTIDRTHLYATLSKTFTVRAPAAAKKPEPAKIEKKPLTAKPEAVKPEKLRKSEIVEAPVRKGADKDRKYLGVGAYVNALNFSGGGSLVFWPLENLAIQGAYGVGTFTSYEGRVFYRLPLSTDFKPYFGAGFLHAERDATVIGLKTTISGDSYTVFGGVEMRLYKNLFGYVDVSGSPMKLKKDVVNGSQAATVTVEYSPVTICTGLMFYLF
jgi:hypothetical protein